MMDDVLTPDHQRKIASSHLIGELVRQLRPAAGGLVVLTLLTGVIFPLALYGIAQGAFPHQARGSLLVRDNVVRGSSLIAQAFVRPTHFHPRPSAAGAGYDGTASGGTNLGPSNPKLLQDIAGLAAAYRRDNGLAPDATIPIDAVTRSASGLDPDISPQDADLQAGRVARARGLPPSTVRALVAAHTKGRQLGFLGQPRVPVLELNMALDQVSGAGPG